MDNEMSKIDLNLADEEMLATLPGIGPALAARIVEFRETVHPFEEVIELAAVPGVSERMVRALAGNVTVTPEEPEALESRVGPYGEVVLVDRTDAALEELGAADSLQAEELSESSDGERILEAGDEIGAGEEAAADTSPDGAGIADVQAESEPLLVITPEPAPVERPAMPGPSRWRLYATALLAGTIGALVGLILTLIVISSLNGGTLRFASARTAGDLEEQLDREASAAGQEREELSRQMDLLGERADSLVEEATTLGQQQESLRRALDETQGDVSAVEELAVELEEQIGDVARAAEDFDAFLIGLRSLLDELQGPLATPTAAVTATPEAEETPEPTSEATPSPQGAPTETSRPATRTPRPTVTPLNVPQSTATP